MHSKVVQRTAWASPLVFSQVIGLSMCDFSDKNRVDFEYECSQFPKWRQASSLSMERNNS